MQVTAVEADVTQPDDAAKFVDRCVAELGGIDIVVNNVGGSAGGPTILRQVRKTGTALLT